LLFYHPKPLQGKVCELNGCDLALFFYYGVIHWLALKENANNVHYSLTVLGTIMLLLIIHIKILLHSAPLQGRIIFCDLLFRQHVHFPKRMELIQ